MADAEPDDVLLARLLEQFRDLRRSNPKAGIGSLHAQAGRLFDRLADLADCEQLLRAAVAPDDEDQLAEFAGYRILEQVGEGAAGVVYRALAPDGSTVALKVMRPTLVASAEAVQRFAKEARVAARLDHPGIARVFDSGHIDGRMYIAMELLEGRSLGDLLKRLKALGGAAPDDRWLRVLDESGIGNVGGVGERKGAAYARRLAKALAPVADALGALAEQGIVHRDIKPQNLVFDARGNLKVTDFGLAKVFGETITETVAVLGTPAYMSPEQARGESRNVDRRTDVYSLGATLYEALTLRHPVRCSTFGEALAAIPRQRPEPIASFCAEYAGPLSVLVGRCLEKDPRDRYQEPADLARELEQFAETSSVSARPVSPARRFRRAVGRNPAPAATIGGTLGVALVVAFALAARPAKVMIRTIPPGAVAIDGEPRGNAPWQGTLKSGRHELVLSLDRFEPRRESLDLSAGQEFGDTYLLRPADESDPVALGMIGEAVGLKVSLPSGAPPTARGAAGALWSDEAALVSPRGRVSLGGLAVAVRLADPSARLRASITDARGRALFDRAFTGEEDLRLPVGDFPPGDYRIEVTRDGADGTLSADFAVVDEPGLDARLEAFPRGARNEPAARILAVGELLDARLYSEAFLASEALGSRGPMPPRLALEALAQMGLDDRGVYLELASRYEEASKAGSR